MYIQRTLEPAIKKYLAGPEYIAVIGARQAGKTTLLRHIQEQVEDSTFLTFEDVELRALFDKDVKSFIKLYVEPFRVIFIDEFHYARKGGQSLKFIYDTAPGKKIVVSGSSMLDLTVAAVKHLAGRMLFFTLHPLSFREFLSYRDQRLFRIYEETAGRKRLEQPMLEKFQTLLEEFVVFGGYPRVVIAKDDDERRTILKNIFSREGLSLDWFKVDQDRAVLIHIGSDLSRCYPTVIPRSLWCLTESFGRSMLTVSDDLAMTRGVGRGGGRLTKGLLFCHFSPGITSSFRGLNFFFQPASFFRESRILVTSPSWLQMWNETRMQLHPPSPTVLTRILSLARCSLTFV
jgi:hypothetical protein